MHNVKVLNTTDYTLEHGYDGKFILCAFNIGRDLELFFKSEGMKRGASRSMEEGKERKGEREERRREQGRRAERRGKGKEVRGRQEEEGE